MNELKEQAAAICELVATKADRKELLELSEMKTNKEDSRSQATTIEILHRMLNSLAVLSSELAKVGLPCANESSAGRAYTSAFLYDQMRNVGRWIQGYDPHGIAPGGSKAPLTLTRKFETTLSPVKQINEQSTECLPEFLE